VRSMSTTAKLARLKQVILDEFCLNTAPGYISNGATTHPTVTFLNGLKRTLCRVRKESRLRVQTPPPTAFYGSTNALPASADCRMLCPFAQPNPKILKRRGACRASFTAQVCEPDNVAGGGLHVLPGLTLFRLRYCLLGSSNGNHAADVQRANSSEG